MGEGQAPDSGNDADQPDAAQRKRDEYVGVGILIVVLAAGLFLEESDINPWFKMLGALIDASFAVVGARLVRQVDLAAAMVRVRSLLRRMRQRWAGPWRSGRQPLPFPLKATGAVIIASAMAAVTLLSVPGEHESPPPRGCPAPAEVTVLTSTDSEAWVRTLFDAYARSTVQLSCPTTHVLVFSAPAAPLASAMATGWAANDVQNPLRDIGPRPDLWLPDASGDVAALLRLAAKSGYALPVPATVDSSKKRVTVTPEAITSIGSSPIVVASQGAAARGASMSQALTSAFDVGTGVAAPDPGSTTGRFAMVSYLRDGRGLLGKAPARRRVQAVAGQAGAGMDSVTALCTAGHNSASTAVVTSAQLWRLFTARPSADAEPGESLADDCAGGRPDFAGWSVAEPDSEVVLDHPLVVPTWTATDPRQSAAARRIRDWLASPPGRSAVEAAALSAPVDCSSAGFSLDGGFTPTPCLSVDPESVLHLYDSAKVPGRVLMIMDGSGSMGASVPGGRGSRLQLAGTAFGQAIGQIGGQDELGLWVFPTGAGPPHRTLLDIGTGTAQRRTAAATALRNLPPAGDTPLYTTILGGLTAVTAGPAGRTTALVVLTDGRDTGDLSLEAARKAIAAKSDATGVRLFVVAVGEAACAGRQGLSRLTEGHGGCVDADFDHISDTMARLFESLWKGQ